MTDKKFSVNVAPEMLIYKILQSQPYEIGTALAEFVDNSVQSFINNREAIERVSRGAPTLSIQITIDSASNKLVIEDNAGGISRDDFQKAVRLGTHSQGINNSLSVYGIGMKTSAVWFADRWRIETSTLASNEKLLSEFDLDKLLATGSTEMIVQSEEEHVNNHYTKITILDASRALKNNKDYFRDSVLAYLQETFLKFKFISISIIYDGERLTTKAAFLNTPTPLIYPPVDTNNNPINNINKEWRVDIEFCLGRKKVEGFIMILNRGGYYQPGIRLLRNDRVIIGTKGGSRQNIPGLLFKTKNKYAPQRMYGELNLSNFKVNFMKTGFDDDLDEVYEHIHDLLKGDGELNNFIKQVNYFRSTRLNTKIATNSTTSDNFPDSSKDTKSTDISNGGNAPNGGTFTKHQKNNDKATNKLNEPTFSNTKNWTRIKKSEALISKLNVLNSKKLSNLYNSLCIISLIEHPTLAYVGAWSFMESLCCQLSNMTNRTYKGDFQSFINSRIKSLSPNMPHKTSIRSAMADIADTGNATKHDSSFYKESAKQLAINFETLEPVLIALIDKAINGKENSRSSSPN